MALKLKDTNTLTYSSKAMKGENEQENTDQFNDEVMDTNANGLKKKRRPANLCIECPVCGGPAPDHLHFGGQSCYSCRAFFRRTSPRPITSFRCRSGLNNCIITSGSKSCIPCRLTKCLQIGMDPALVRGKKYKSDSDNEDHANDDDEDYPPGINTIPALTPITSSKIPEESQESLLKFRAEVLKYQGMCLQYQASLLEKQARSMGDTEQEASYRDSIMYNTRVMDHGQDLRKDPKLEHVKNELKDEPKYNPGYESRIRPTYSNILKNNSHEVINYDGRYKHYELQRYPDTSSLTHYYSDIEDQKLTSFSLTGNEIGRKRHHHGCTERDRSPTRIQPEIYSPNTKYYKSYYDSQINFSDIPPLGKEGNRSESPGQMCPGQMSPGPMDLSVKKQSPSPQLHTQAQNMPRIFFRTDPNRI